MKANLTQKWHVSFGLPEADNAKSIDILAKEEKEDGKILMQDGIADLRFVPHNNTIAGYTVPAKDGTKYKVSARIIGGGQYPNPHAGKFIEVMVNTDDDGNITGAWAAGSKDPCSEPGMQFIDRGKDTGKTDANGKRIFEHTDKMHRITVEAIVRTIDRSFKKEAIEGRKYKFILGPKAKPMGAQANVAQAAKSF